MEARLPEPAATFDAARDHVEGLITRLTDGKALSMAVSEVEVFTARESQETIRLLIQAHLDLRAHARPASPVIGSDGMERRHRRVQTVPLRTTVGEVTVTREVFTARDVAGGRAPLDADLNLPGELYSFPLQKRVAVEVSKGSFEEAVEAVKATTAAAVPKRQAEQIAECAAIDFSAFYAHRKASGTGEGTGPILAITGDCTGVVMREEALRPATRKAAAKRRAAASPAGPETAPRKDKKDSRKRMAMVAAVYSIAPHVREPEDIVRDLRPARDVAVRPPRPERKRVWASLEDGPKEVLTEAFEEALRRDPEKTKNWVGLVDGDEDQLSAMRSLAKRHKVKMTIVLDLIHVLGYLWSAAKAFHEDAKGSEAWVSERLLEILRGRSSAVAGGIRRSATKRNLDPKRREPADECADYLLKYKDLLHYDEYLAAGYPIATGVIEGACRHLVKDRMDITGARWGLERGEAVLRLRALRSSGDFEEYWRFHEECELDENHRARYAADEPPKMVLPDLAPKRARRSARGTPQAEGSS